jgi:hypothetical protein
MQRHRGENVTETKTFNIGDKVDTAGSGRGVVAFGPYVPLYAGAQRYAVEFADGRHAGKVGIFNASTLTAVPAFAIGDKVRHAHTGDAVSTIVGGPFKYRFDDHTWWVLEDADGAHESSAENLLTLAPADEPIKVGDRVRVVEDDPINEPGKFVGLVGEVLCVRDSSRARLPYLVKFGDGHHGDTDGKWYCLKVERVDEAAPALKVGGQARVTIRRPDGAELEIGDVVYVVRIDGPHPGDTVQVRKSGGRVWHIAREALEVLPFGGVFVHEGVAYEFGATYRDRDGDRDGDRWKFHPTRRASNGTPIGAMNGADFRDDDSYSLSYAVDSYGPLRKV